MDSLLAPCRAKALAEWPQARQRLLAGLPDRQRMFVVTRLYDSNNAMEQVFVLVERIEGDHVIGRLYSRMGTVAGYQWGQALEVKENEIYDWMIARPDGTEEGNWTGKFIDELNASGTPSPRICAP